jgi:uncharacterized protein
MRIGIDIDSTLHHYWDVFSAAVHRRFGIALPYEDQMTWTIDALRPEQVRACIEETHRDEHVLAAEPYAGAVEVVSRWHDEGHFIHITSHRTPSAQAVTARWLERIGLRHHDLHCSWDKIARCREIGIELLIDDSPVNLVRARDAGIRPATLEHPWNRDVREGEGILCAPDWPRLAGALAPVLARGPDRRS